MDARGSSRHELLGVIDRAMRRAHHIDTVLYAELFALRTKLEHEAALADAELTRAHTRPRMRVHARA
jgi:hypothetical protein